MKFSRKLYALFFLIPLACLSCTSASPDDSLANDASLSITQSNKGITATWKASPNSHFEHYILQVVKNNVVVSKQQIRYNIAQTFYTVTVPFQNSTSILQSGNYSIILMVLEKGSTEPRKIESNVTTVEVKPPSQTTITTPVTLMAEGVKIEWVPPTDYGIQDNGSAASILHYTVYWQEGKTVSTQSYVGKSEPQEDTQYTAKKLKAKTAYSFIVVTTNNVTLTSVSNVVTISETRAEQPDSVEIQTKEILGKDAVKLTWQVPRNAGKRHDGSPAKISSYVVYWKEGASVDSTSENSKTIEESQTPHAIVIALKGNTLYSFVVLAVNDVVHGKPSSTITLNTPSQRLAPGSVKIVEIQPQIEGLRVYWDPPTEPGKTDKGDPATLSYTLYWKKGREIAIEDETYDEKKAMITKPEYTVTGLESNAEYSFIVRALNSADLSGPISTRFTTTTHKVIPVYTWKQLQNIELDKHYKLMQDIIFPEPGQDGFPKTGFRPIGSKDMPFVGTLDGNNKKIISLYINDRTLTYGGLFAAIRIIPPSLRPQAQQSVVVRDLIFVNPSISVKVMAGTVVAILRSGELNNIQLSQTRNMTVSALSTDSSMGGDVECITGDKGYGCIGGIAADVWSYGSIRKSSSNLSIIADSGIIGGLAGTNAGSVSGYTTGNIQGTTTKVYYIGGLTGTNNKTRDHTGIVTGYSSAQITSQNVAGGLVGHSSYHTAVTGYSTSTVTGVTTGGLVGSNNGYVKGYSTGEIIGIDSAGGLVGNTIFGNITGYSTATIRAKKNVGGLLGYGFATTLTGYATGPVFVQSKLAGGLIGEVANSIRVVGYALNYISSSTSIHNVSSAIGTLDNVGSENANIILYVGRSNEEQKSESEHKGTGDHVANGTSTEQHNAVVEGLASRQEKSFNGFTFDTADWNWTKGYTTDWPILNIPDKIPLSDYSFADSQNPKISKPSGFKE